LRALPASKNQLISSDPEEYPKMAVIPEEDTQDQEEGEQEDEEEDEVEDEDEEEEVEDEDKEDELEVKGEEEEDEDEDEDEVEDENEIEDEDDLEDEDDNEDYGDDDTNEGNCCHINGIYIDSNEIDAQSEVNQQTFSDKLSCSAGSASEIAVTGSVTELQMKFISKNYEITILHHKRPYNGLQHSEQEGEADATYMLKDTHTPNHNHKKIQSEKDIDTLTFCSTD
jgi:hypothetical protein